MKINVLEQHPDLQTAANATASIQAAIDQCSQHDGGQVVIPAGQYVIDSLLLKSNVDLHLEAGAKLLGSGNEDH